MALKLHDGNVYPVKLVRCGENDRGKYTLVVIKAANGRAECTLFLKNEDHGFVSKDELNNVSIRVDSFECNSANENDGVALSYGKDMKGEWKLKVTVQGCIGHKVGDACDVGGGFEQATFETVSDDAELPF